MFMLSSFPHTHIEHYPVGGLDHAALVLNTNAKEVKGSKCFKFETVWCSFNGYLRLLTKARLVSILEPMIGYWKT